MATETFSPPDDPPVQWPRFAAAIIPTGLAVIAVVILIGMAWPVDIVVLAGTMVGLLAIRWPEVGLTAMVIAIPLQDSVQGRIGTDDVTFSDAVVVAILCAWGLRSLLAREWPCLSPVSVTYGLHVGVVALSVLAARQTSLWSVETTQWVMGFGVYVLAHDVLSRRRGAIAAIVLVTVVGTTVLSGYAFYQVQSSAGPESFRLDGVTRAFATFRHPNVFAGYLDLTVPIALAIACGWLGCPRGWEKLAGWPRFGIGIPASVAVVAGFGGAVTSQSRGGWLGLLVGCGLVIWLTGGPVRLFAICGGLALAILVLASPVGSQITGRIAASSVEAGQATLVTPENFAVQERLAHWRAGVAMAREHPWLGVGAGNYKERFREFTPSWRFRVARSHAHNAFIHAAAQTGLVGFATYSLAVGTIAWRLRRGLRATRGTPASVVVIGVTGACAAFFTHGLFDYLHAYDLPKLLGITVALGEAVARRPGPGPWRRPTRRTGYD